MRGLISPTSQHCWKNVLDTGSRRSDRGPRQRSAGDRDRTRRRAMRISTVLTLAILAVVVIAVVFGARYISARRKLRDETMILQSQLSDIVAREPQLQGLFI